MHPGVSQMTLEQKIGQLMVCGFPTAFADDAQINEAISRFKAGNIILFARNLKNRAQIMALTGGLQRRIIDATGWPALVAADQEGGMVTRIFHGATFMPGAMAIAATADPENARRAGRIIGEEMLALGLNYDLAPCADIGTDVRFFSDNFHAVAQFAGAFAKGIQESGAIATLKHFPGYDRTQASAWDPHFFAASHMGFSRSRLNKTVFRAFGEALRISGADSVMANHAVAPSLGTGRRVTNGTRALVTGILKEQLGFEGLIITDCIEMAALSKSMGQRQGPVAAIKAGCHLLCISHTLGAQENAFDALLCAVRAGDLPEDTLDERVSDILYMKEKYRLREVCMPAPERVEAIDWEANQAFAREISRDSIVLAQDAAMMLPLPREGGVFVSPPPIAMNMLDEKFAAGVNFATRAAETFGGRAVVLSSLWPDEAERAAVAEACRDAKYIVFATDAASKHPEQAALHSALLALNRNYVSIALRETTDYAVCGDAPCYLFALEYTALSVESLMEVLAGNREATGVLPTAAQVYIRPQVKA